MKPATLTISLLAVHAVGCVRLPGGIAPSSIPLAPDSYTVLGPVEAGDCKINLFGILPVSGGNHVSDALAGALAQRPQTDALVQVTVDRVSKWFIFWTQVCTEVRGIAVTRN